MFSLSGTENFTNPLSTYHSPSGDGQVGENGTWSTIRPHGDHPGHDFVHAAEAYIQPVILGIGIVSNILSLLVLRRTRIVSVFKICIVSLTITDLLAAIFGFAQILVEVIYFGGDIPFGYYYKEAIASHTLYYIFLMFMCTSSGIIILIVLIRSFMVYKPLESKKYLTAQNLKVVCSLICVATFIIFLPTSINIIYEVCYHEHLLDNAHPLCVHYYENLPYDKVGMKYLYALTILYGPLLIIVYIICFVSIHINLQKADMEAKAMMNEKINTAEFESRMKQTARVTRVLLAILIAECICIIPTCIQGVGLILAPKEYIFDKNFPPANVIDVICEIFLCWRPTVNFLIYVCMHKEFRRRLCSMLKREDHTYSGSKGSNNSTDSYNSPARGCKKSNSVTTNATHMTAIEPLNVKNAVKREENPNVFSEEQANTQETCFNTSQNIDGPNDSQNPSDIENGHIENENMVNGGVDKNQILSTDNEDVEDEYKETEVNKLIGAPQDEEGIVKDDGVKNKDAAGLDDTFEEIDALLAQTEQYISDFSNKDE